MNFLTIDQILFQFLLSSLMLGVFPNLVMQNLYHLILNLVDAVSHLPGRLAGVY